ncbi:Uncharacterised protein [Serratia entomophila]|uniref:hypothetical protein n=1 Tax=Serratia entomophila TaxID=42906 RepID=UPI00217A5877|nr:hypothetical protein [Serratia entomophila]CAI1775760.1 Uncharacterised protein [Serratia entomophila]CAI2926341.1 Uncharacterised protein [Serratia entomophila]
MSESNGDGVIESVKKTLVERINTPLFGFIFLSWIAFNWDNILFVMLSEASIEKRISAIKLGSEFYFKGLVCPAFSGFILSVAFPYLQLLVSSLQKWALPFIDKNNNKAALRGYASDVALANSKADAAIATELAKAAAEARLAGERNRRASLDYASEQLKVEFDSLKNKIKLANESNDELNSKISNLIEMEKELIRRTEVLSREKSELESSIGGLENVKANVLGFGNNIGYSTQRIMTELEYYSKNLDTDGSLINDVNKMHYTFPVEWRVDKMVDVIKENIRIIDNEINEQNHYLNGSN